MALPHVVRRWAADVPVLQSPGNAAGGIAGIQADNLGVETEADPLPVETIQIDNAVMDIGRCGMGVGNDGQIAVDRAMIEIEEALGLAVAHHVAGLGVGARNLGFLLDRLAILLLQRLLAVSNSIRIDGRIQIVPIVGSRLGNDLLVIAVLVGIGLQVGRVGVENLPSTRP